MYTLYYYLFLLLVVLIPLRNVVLKTMSLFEVSGLNIINVLYGVVLLGALVAPRKKEGETYSSKVFLPLIIFIFYFFLQIWVQPGDHSYAELLKWWKDSFLLMLIPYLFVTRAITDQKKILIVLAVMLVANVYMDSYFWRWVRWMSFDSFADKMKSVNGTFGDVGGCNEWAAFFSTYTLVIIAVVRCLTKKSWKMFLNALIACNVLVLIFTFSRGGYIGFVAGLGYFFLKTKKYAFFIALVCLPLFYTVVLPTPAVERIEMSFESTAFGEVGDQDVASRLEMWKQAISMTADAPLFGHGLLSFRHEHWRNPHNQHLNLLVQGGIVGYCLFFWLFLAVLREGQYLFRIGHDAFARSIGIGVGAMAISLFVANIFGDRWSYYVLSGYFWVLCGVVDFYIRDSLHRDKMGNI